MFCRRPGCGSTGCSSALWDNTDDVDAGSPRAMLDGRYTWLEAGVLDPSEGTGPWIADWEAGASREHSVARKFSGR